MSTPLDFSLLKVVTKRKRLLVCGCIKNMKSKYTVIPNEIVNVIILFLQTRDRFTRPRDRIKLENDGSIAIIRGCRLTWTSIYGELAINCNDIKQRSGIYEWQFNLECDRVSIGIISATPNVAYCFCVKNCYYYAVGDDGNKERTSSKGRWIGQGGGRYYCNKAQKGDKVTMKLNLPQRTLSFNKNGVDLGNAYDDIDVSESMVYHMAVVLLGEVEDYVEIALCSIQFDR